MYCKNQLYENIVYQVVLLIKKSESICYTFTSLFVKTRIETVWLYIHIMTIELKNGEGNYDCQYILFFLYFSQFFRVCTE